MRSINDLGSLYKRPRKWLRKL